MGKGEEGRREERRREERRREERREERSKRLVSYQHISRFILNKLHTM